MTVTASLQFTTLRLADLMVCHCALNSPCRPACKVKYGAGPYRIHMGATARLPGRDARLPRMRWRARSAALTLSWNDSNRYPTGVAVSNVSLNDAPLNWCARAQKGMRIKRHCAQAPARAFAVSIRMFLMLDTTRMSNLREVFLREACF